MSLWLLWPALTASRSIRFPRLATLVAVILAMVASAEAAGQSSVEGGGEEASVVEYLHTRVRFESDGRSLRTLEGRVRVLGEQGVREWGQLSFAYSSSFETMTFEQLEVRKADGRIVTPSRDAEQESGLAVDPTAPVFSDHRQRQVALAGLRPGDSVAFKVTWTVHTPPAAGEFWFAHRFSSQTQTDVERLEIDVPAGREVVVRTRPGQPGALTETTGARRTFRWERSHVPPRPPVDAAPSADAFVLRSDPPDVLVTTFADWASVGAWFAARLHPAGAPSDVVRTRARELTAGLSGSDTQARALFAFVAREVRYVSVAVGDGQYSARAPEEVLRTLYGDCKDKHALLAALLASVGIESLPALTSLSTSIDSEIPSPGQFDHVVTVIPLGPDPDAWHWVDATIDSAPFGYLALPMRGQRALVALPGAADLVGVPDVLPFRGGVNTKVTGRVTTIGALEASVEQRVRGDAAVVLRSVLSRLTPAQQLDLARASAAAAGLTGEFTEAAVLGLDRPDDPIGLSTRLRQAGFLSWAQETSVVSPALPKIEVSGETLRAWQQLDEMDFLWPVAVEFESELTLPAGYGARPPVGVTLERDYASYASTYAVEGLRLVSRRVFELKVRRLAADRSADFLAFVSAIRADEAQRFEVRAPSIDVPVLPEDASVAELYSAGTAAYTHRRDAAAATIYQRVVDLNPSHGSAWHALGLALWRLDRLDEAEAAIEKQVDLNRFHERAHRDLGDLLSRRQEWDRALAAYRHHLDIVPLDGRVLAAAGRLAGARSDYADAVLWLEKAIALGGADAWSHVYLGEALLGLGRTEQGVASVRRGVELDGSTRVRAVAAGTLARWRVELEEAAGWAERAVSEATAATAAISLDAFSREGIRSLHDLAYSWAAKGRVLAAEGRLADAEAWLTSAWKYSGDPNIVEALGMAHEARGDRERAATTYAQAITENRKVWPSVRNRLTSVTSPERVDRLVDAALRSAPANRAVILSQGVASPGRAYVAVVLDPDGTIRAARCVAGDDTLATIAERLVGLKAPYQLHAAVGERLVAPVNLACTAGGCVALFVSFFEAAFSPANDLRWP